MSASPSLAAQWGPPRFSDLCADLAAPAEAAKEAALQSDAICLQVGTRLSEAVPNLNDLSGRFTALSELLDGGDLSNACTTLQSVVQDVAGIGEGLARESETLANLVKLNGVLSRRIVNVADDIRFLSAMITSVKVESASIQDETEGLQGFAQTLERLTSNAQSTIESYHTKHDMLLRQLRQASKVQAAFEMTRQADLLSVARGIEESLASISTRRKAIAVGATSVGDKTRRIGMQVAQSVVALQIGDTTRQRIEHVAEALLLLKVEGARRGGSDPSLLADLSAQERWFLIARLCRLQMDQIGEAGGEFRSEIKTIAALLTELDGATADLTRTSSDLFGSHGNPSLSFLGDLGAKLKIAHNLIHEYRQSRATVDGLTEAVIATFSDLERLGASVAAMVIDMTIIGTNAIVKSYRLGQRGAGLSIIAQHLRLHSLRIADGIKLLTPALHDALTAAQTFARSLTGQSASRMAELGSRMSTVLESFAGASASLTEAIQRLERDADGVGGMLDQAITKLRETDEVDACVQEAADGIRTIGEQIGDLATPSATVDQRLDAVLRPRYTMVSERKIHDALFASVRRDAPPAATVETDDLEAVLF